MDDTLTMTLAIEVANLNAAAQRAMDNAGASGTRTVDDPEVADQRYDMADIDQVRAYLRQHAQQVYARQAGTITEGLIVAMPFKGVGLMFDRAPTRWAPADSIEVLGEGEPTHLAAFWAPLRTPGS